MTIPHALSLALAGLCTRENAVILFGIILAAVAVRYGVH